MTVRAHMRAAAAVAAAALVTFAAAATAVAADAGVAAAPTSPGTPATPDGGPQRSLLAADPDAPTLTTRLEKYTVAFGDPVILILGVIHRRGVTVNLPTAPDLGPFGVLHTTEDVKDLADGNIKHEFRLRLLPYDVGRLTVPPIEVVYLNTVGQWRTLHSDSVNVEVTSLIANEPDAKIKSHTAPVTVFEQNYTLLWIVGGAAAVLLIAALTMLVASRIRRRAVARRPPAPARPAVDVALERLERLRDTWLGGAAGQADLTGKDLAPYYFELSEILRGYLGARFGFDSLELTTTELVEALRRHVAGDDLQLELQAWLEDCDLVKFAKIKVDADEAQRAWQDGRRFVLATRPVVVTPVEGQGPGAAAGGGAGPAAGAGPGGGSGRAERAEVGA